MINEDITKVRLSIKNGSLPQFAYSYINENALNSDIDSVAKKLMSLQPELGADETQIVTKCVESVISYEMD